MTPELKIGDFFTVDYWEDGNVSFTDEPLILLIQEGTLLVARRFVPYDRTPLILNLRLCHVKKLTDEFVCAATGE